ncbi:tellurite resistance/C4-dicarboxylate transporter family protein [Nafulsella turpanensis]|uniref:tellurite resistance/C4-dicarboxylate transporter family protein n=1 Tax=Nafulsella turpanensis TaxID=1265690 RepID=UPI00034491C3|nr:tellurite resistance/C4-dicarboxylate transporter family protein [Nafulsella turpanensis]
MDFFQALKKEVQMLSPAYFTLPMSVGILSIGADFLKLPTLSDSLFWVNNVVYGILLLMLLARLLFFTHPFLKDLKSFKKGAGFLSFIAATSILGIQYVKLQQAYTTGSILFWCSLGIWILLMYSFLMSVTTQSEKPSLEKGMSGVWLLIVVSTQALAIHGTLLAKHLSIPKEQVIFLTLCLYTLGIFLYLILITLIFYRLTFFPAKPKEITPPYWINEGAVGITTLAGAVLLQNINSSSGFTGIEPVIEWISLLAWATASWWIPFIILLEIWKYGIKKEKLTYTPTYWALVFCIGGYAAATHLLFKVLSISFLTAAPKVAFYVALALFGIVLLGMCISIIKSLSSNHSKKTS